MIKVKTLILEFWNLDNPKINKAFQICKKLAEFQISKLDVLISESKPKQFVTPVFKWGQSNEEIFIEIKLSHRFDSPGCLESIKAEKVEEMVTIKDCRVYYFLIF